MIDDEDSVQMSGYCFNLCEVLKTVTQGNNPDDLNESVKTGLGDLQR